MRARRCWPAVDGVFLGTQQEHKPPEEALLQAHARSLSFWGSWGCTAAPPTDAAAPSGWGKPLGKAALPNPGRVARHNGAGNDLS